MAKNIQKTFQRVLMFEERVEKHQNRSDLVQWTLTSRYKECLVIHVSYFA